MPSHATGPTAHENVVVGRVTVVGARRHVGRPAARLASRFERRIGLRVVSSALSSRAGKWVRQNRRLVMVTPKRGCARSRRAYSVAECIAYPGAGLVCPASGRPPF